MLKKYCYRGKDFEIITKAIGMDIKDKKSILKKYLGFYPAWFDLRKREIINDNIDIRQWQINMNYLIHNYGTIDSSEKKAFAQWHKTFEALSNDESDFGEYLEENVTACLLYLSPIDLPHIFHRDQDRNWFLAAYPDVFEYFYPQFDLTGNDDFNVKKRRFEEQYEAIKPIYERMAEYITTEKRNQTIYLIRMKDFYKNELKKNFQLSF